MVVDELERKGCCHTGERAATCYLAIFLPKTA